MKQIVEYVPPPPKSEEDVVSLKEHGTLEEPFATQIIENVLGDLELEGSDLVVAPREVI